jgi:hypothetical protein
MEKGLQSISNYKEKEEMTKRKTTHKRTRNQTHRKGDDPMKLIGFGVKGIVGVTALGITANALSDIAKNSH